MLSSGCATSIGSARSLPIADLPICRLPKQEAGRAGRAEVVSSMRRPITRTTLRVERAPWTFVLSRIRVYRTWSRVEAAMAASSRARRSSAVLAPMAQLAGPCRSLDPPRIAGAVCRVSPRNPGPRGLHPQRADFQRSAKHRCCFFKLRKTSLRLLHTERRSHIPKLRSSSKPSRVRARSVYAYVQPVGLIFALPFRFNALAREKRG